MLTRTIPASVRRCAAFTLLELLTVLAIVGIIAAVSIGTIQGARERAALALTRAEVASLAQALEDYRVQYGDFPRTNDSAVLLQSLLGKRKPDGSATTGRKFLELSKFRTVDGRDPVTDSTAQLADPLGRAYRYGYAATWRPPAFVLYAVGKDGLDVAPDAVSGDPRFSAAANLDNVYAGRE